MKIQYAFGAAILALSTPAAAEVKSVAENGFSVVHIANVNASPMVIWSRLIAPKDYWNKTHSWSGSVDGFYIDPKAGGCFCENMVTQDAKGKNKVAGTVEHMRVIFADPGKVLRMQGALGPLQSEAVLGTMTVAIVPAKSGGGSTVSFTYVVGGYIRYKTPEIAAAVDKVIGEQFTSMIKPFVAATVESEPVPFMSPITSPDGNDSDMSEDKSSAKQGEWSLDLDDLAKEDAPVAADKPAPKTATKSGVKPKPKTGTTAKISPKTVPKTAPKTAPKPAVKPATNTPAKPVVKVKPKPKPATTARKDPEVR